MKTKKFIVLMLCVFILVSNIGLTFKVHYCMNSIASVSIDSQFTTSDSDKNCCDSVKKKSSCCKNKVFYFQKKTEQKETIPFAFNTDLTCIVNDWKPIIFSVETNFKSQNSSSYYCDAHAPPLFKLYHQFIFYA
jgi:hypothetical protein